MAAHVCEIFFQWDGTFLTHATQEGGGVNIPLKNSRIPLIHLIIELEFVLSSYIYLKNYFSIQVCLNFVDG